MIEDRTTIEALEPVVELMAKEQSLPALLVSVKVLKEQIEGILPRYSSENYNSDNIAEAKADRALLNKLSKAVNDKRIAFEREFLRPLTEFKGEVTETIALVRKASDAIDAVVKAQEEKERNERKALIERLWEEQVFHVVPLHQIKRPEWLLKATSKKSIVADMSEIVRTIIADMASLESTAAPEDWNSVKLFYLADLDFRRALSHIEKLKEQRARDAEQALRAAEAPPEVPAPAPEPEPVEAPPAPPAPPVRKAYDPNEVLTRTFRVVAPAHQIVRLGDFMKANHIAFEKLGDA